MISKKLSLKLGVLHCFTTFLSATVVEVIYANSGIVMIFKKTKVLKKEAIKTPQLEPHIAGSELSPKQKLGIKFKRSEGDVLYFEDDNYTKVTAASIGIILKRYFIVENIERSYKAITNSFNIFFIIPSFRFLSSIRYDTG